MGDKLPISTGEFTGFLVAIKSKYMSDAVNPSALTDWQVMGH